MAVSTKHPDYTRAREDEWKLCRHAYQGEGEIKRWGEIYLPRPSGYSTEGGYSDAGDKAYNAYKSRAQFPEMFATSVGAMTGIIHDEVISVELPSALEYLREDADGQGTPLDEFHREITREILLTGRYGILTDAPETGGDPFLVGYEARRLINWDQGFYVIDESGDERTGFAWQNVERYRVLELIEGRYTVTIHRNGIQEPLQPSAQGGAAINFLPFVIANAVRVGHDIYTPPLIGVARHALAMYQLSADYRLQLYMSGQETLVAINGDAPSAVGAGVVHEMHGTAEMTPDLKYVSPSCSGIDAHLEAIELNQKGAVQSGARLFEQGKHEQESGNARAMRMRSETANLKTVAMSSCSALEMALRYAAQIKGLDGSDVIVTPPVELLASEMDAASVKALWDIASAGGMSYATFYENLVRGGYGNSDRTADEEYALIEGQEFSDLTGP